MLVSPLKFATQFFRYNKQIFNVVVTPQFSFSEEDLVFTGDFIGILNSPTHSTIPFVMTLIINKGWKIDKAT